MINNGVFDLYAVDDFAMQVIKLLKHIGIYSLHFFFAFADEGVGGVVELDVVGVGGEEGFEVAGVVGVDLALDEHFGGFVDEGVGFEGGSGFDDVLGGGKISQVC